MSSSSCVTSVAVAHRSRGCFVPRALALAVLAATLPQAARPATLPHAAAAAARPYALVQALHRCNTAHYCTSGGSVPADLGAARPRPDVSGAAPHRGKATPTARPSATPTARPSAAPTTVPSAAPAQAMMLGLINAERAQAGAAPLTLDPTLNTIAQWRSQDMIDRDYFSHQIPGLTGVGMVFDVLDHDDVQYQMAGENIALNTYINYYPLAQTVQQTNTDFMNSPEHRDNILEPKYSKIGLGLAFQPGTGKLIVTEVFVQS